MDSPVIWVLEGARVGDNAQAQALARAVGGKIVVKSLVHNFFHALPNVMLGATAATLKREAAVQLRPPWPDVVVAVGKRSAPVALWIKQQSGNLTRVVHIGRPRAALARFDLVISTPQYGLPAASNVLELQLPMSQPVPVAAEDVSVWRDTWLTLPRPWLVAAVGGAKFPQRLGMVELRRFGRALNDLASAQAGSVLLFDSPRSRKDALGVVSGELTVPVWRSDGVATQRDAYQAALAVGEAFVVTSDSASMIAEMIETARPVHVLRLPAQTFSPRWSGRGGLGRMLSQSGLLQPPRDVLRLVDGLLNTGVVGELGVRGPTSVHSHTGESGLNRAAARVREMLPRRN